MIIDNRMDLGISSAFGVPYRLRRRPPFPPVAHRWILTWLLSKATWWGAADDPATASNILCQTPFSLQRANRL
jgi:hypothetical protein